jgi:TPR repeat protein
MRGNTAAQVKLAEIYANGRGVPRSYFQAYIWYSLAVRCGNTTVAAERTKAAGGHAAGGRSPTGGQVGHQYEGLLIRVFC